MTNPISLAPFDPAVPGLGVATRADDLFEILSKHLPECREGMIVKGGRAVDVQYTPGVGAQVLWKIKVRDPESGRTRRQFIFVRALQRDESFPAAPTELIQRYQSIRAGRGMLREMPFRTPWLPVPESGVIIHAFPLDPGLPTLMDIADPKAMKQSLGRLWNARHANVRRVRVDTLSYTPGMRAAMSYEVLAEDARSLVPELRHLVGKLDVKRSPARLFAGHWLVWRSTFGRVSVPPPVGYLAVARVSLQEFLTGTRLSDLAGKGEFIGKIRKTAHALAYVHSLMLPVLKHRSVEKEMTGVERWTKVLAKLRPVQAKRLENLRRRIHSELAERMRVTAIVHADFHLANVLADKHGVTFVDWDQAAHGDPMLDVGRLLSSLRVSAFRVNGALDGLSHVEEAFLSSYLRLTGDDERRARLFEAASLLTAASAPFRLQREGWEQYADLMIDEVERILDLACRGPAIPGTPADFQRQVPFAERHVWAADRMYAQALLVPIVHDAYGSDIEITDCRPRVLERNDSRIRVRWNLSGYRKDIDWSRTVEGVGFPAVLSHGPMRRIETARRISADDPEILRLPRPLGIMKPLSFTIFEPVDGDPLLRVVDNDSESGMLDRLALSLARFHSTQIELAKEHTRARIINSVAARVSALENSGHPDATAARDLLGALESVIESVDERRAPTCCAISVKHVRISDTAISLCVVRDLVMGEPLSTVGSVAAQLRLIALKRGTAQIAADRFVRAYADAAGESEDQVNAWQSLHLLKAGCKRAARDVSSPLGPMTINAARELVEELVARPAS